MAETQELLIGTEDGLVSLSSKDGGASWSDPEMLMPDTEAHALRAGPNGTVFLGTRGKGLFRGTGDLRRWESLDTPPAALKARSLCWVDDHLLVGTEAGEHNDPPVGVFSWSERAGWKAMGEITTCPGSSEWFYPAPFEEVHVRWLSVDPHQAGRLYAAVQVGGVGISPDEGRTWYDKRNLDVDTHMVEPSPGHAGTVYAGAGGGFFRSRDYGESWEQLAEEAGPFVVQFALDPSESDVLYLGTARGHVMDWPKPPKAQGELFRSEDGGDSWRKLGGGLPERMESRINVMYVDPVAPEHVFMGGGLPSGARNPGIAADAGVYHSPDRGATWHQIFSLDKGEPLAVCCVHR